jgi:hypothetical protein
MSAGTIHLVLVTIKHSPISNIVAIFSTGSVKPDRRFDIRAGLIVCEFYNKTKGYFFTILPGLWLWRLDTSD